MIGRLMEFEIRSSLKYLAALWVAVLASSLLFGFAGRGLGNLFSEKMGMFMSTLDIILTFIFWAAFAAMIVGTVIVIILRFYKGMMGEEGYLMHTLPVKTWELITAKGVVAAGLVLVSSIVAILSIMISTSIMGAEVLQAIREFMNAVGETPMLILIIIEALILVLLGILGSIYEVYAAMSIGQMVGKHRVLMSLGAYLGIEAVLDILGVMLISAGSATGLWDAIARTFENIPLTADPSAYMVAAQPEILGIFLLCIIQLAAFHVITERILSTRLNLQ